MGHMEGTGPLAGRLTQYYEAVVEEVDFLHDYLPHRFLAMLVIHTFPY